MRVVAPLLMRFTHSRPLPKSLTQTGKLEQPELVDCASSGEGVGRLSFSWSHGDITKYEETGMIECDRCRRQALTMRELAEQPCAE